MLLVALTLNSELLTPNSFAGSFLRLPAGARGAALGETGAASAEGAEAMYWNPAALAPARAPSVHTSRLFYHDDTQVDALAASWPGRWGGAGLSSRWFWGPELDRVRNGVSLGDFSPVERAADLALAARAGILSAGVLGRYYRRTSAGQGDSSVMTDAGLLLSSPRSGIRLGAAGQNMGRAFGGTGAAQSSPPAQWRAGLALRSPEGGLLLALEHVKPREFPGAFHAGLELWAGESAAFRLGYVARARRDRDAGEPFSDWRTGLGIRIKHMDLDYAFAPAPFFGEAHHLSLSVRFAGLTQLEHAGRVSLEADPAAFSPDFDGRNDSAFVQLGSEGVAGVSRWLIDVRTPQGARVRRFSGHGQAPGLTGWDGRDQRGRAMPEGDYLVQGRVWGARQQAVSAPLRLTIDTTPPSLAVRSSTPSFTPDGDGREDAVSFSLQARDKNALAGWSLKIFPAGMPSSRPVFAASGPFRGDQASVDWDGRSTLSGDAAPNGAYDVQASARDAAGNLSEIQVLPLDLRARPEAVLDRISALVRVETVPGGFRIRLPSETVFGGPRAALVSDTFHPLRDQLVQLARAFPDRRVVLNGRVGSEKAAARRSELASRQAWALYSALVKAGLPAVRMEVHGLPQKPKTPNTVEILLLSPETP